MNLPRLFLAVALATGLIASAAMAKNCQRGCTPPPVDPPPPPVIIMPTPPPPTDTRDPWLTDRQVSYSFCCPWRGQLRMHTAFGRDPSQARADCLARDTTARQCTAAIGRLIDRADARTDVPADRRMP